MTTLSVQHMLTKPIYKLTKSLKFPLLIELEPYSEFRNQMKIAVVVLDYMFHKLANFPVNSHYYRSDKI